MSLAQAQEHQKKHGFLQDFPARNGTTPPIVKRNRMNKTESEYALILDAKFPESTIRYEAYTLKLAEGCRYTPDFAIEHRDGTLEFHEVKGAFIFSKALTKPKTANELFPQKFILAQKLKTEWEITELKKAR